MVNDDRNIRKHIIMEIIQYSNGPEGAKNPSMQNKTGIQTPDNGSYQQSLYIAAISQFIGCEGLASPAKDVRDGVGYTFDFYHRECGKVFKVLKSVDLSEYEKYTQYVGDVFVIVDVDGHPGCQLGECACCGEQYIILPRDLGEKLHDTDATYLYFQHRLCAYVRDTTDGKSQWIILDPVALREYEDEESEGEDDDSSE